MTHTINHRRTLSAHEDERLEALARHHERDLRFARHSPRDERWIPFADERSDPPVTLPEALVWLAAAAVLIFLMFIVLGLEP